MEGALAARDRLALELQRGVSRLLSPLWVPLLAVLVRGALRWRVHAADRRALRATLRRLRAESDAPLLVCANHLTMFDSVVIAWALGSPGFYLRDFGALPWNTPERTNFDASRWSRLIVYLTKCVPVRRGADRGEVARWIAKVRHLLERGEVVLIFPEGGRSRSGRVEPDSAAYGVGRLVRSVPGCRVLCVYARGDAQHTWSKWPRRGEHFHVSGSCLEPKAEHEGLRGSVEIARQIVTHLVEMERRHFDDRQ